MIFLKIDKPYIFVQPLWIVSLCGLSFIVLPFSTQAEEDQWRLCNVPAVKTSSNNNLVNENGSSASKEMKFFFFN